MKVKSMFCGSEGIDSFFNHFPSEKLGIGKGFDFWINGYKKLFTFCNFKKYCFVILLL